MPDIFGVRTCLICYIVRHPPKSSYFCTFVYDMDHFKNMAEPAPNEAPAPAAMDEQPDHQQVQQHPPALPLEAASAKAPEERNEELEIAIRGALEGPDKELGRLCRTLGDNFCLAPHRPKHSVQAAAGYDSGSDTTSPADQEHSSSSSGSETGGDHAAVPRGAPGEGGGGSSDNGKDMTDSGGDDEHDEILQAVAAAARVSCDTMALLVVGVL